MNKDKIRIGQFIYLVVPMLNYPYFSIEHKCGEVKMGVDGEYIQWYA